MPEVTFSILVGAYRSEPYVDAFIASVRAQTREDWELIIVDDASPDGVGDRIRQHLGDPRITALRHATNRGCPAARNTAAARARGRYLVFVDSDDLLREDFLARMHEAVTAAPGFAIAGCAQSRMDQAGRPKRDPAPPPSTDGPREELLLAMLRGPFKHGPVCVLHRDTFAALGPFEERAAFGDDYEMWVRALAAEGGAVIVREPIYRYRVHGASMTFDPANEAANYRKFLDTLDLMERRLAPTAERAAALRHHRRRTERLLAEARFRTAARAGDRPEARDAARVLCATGATRRDAAKRVLAVLPGRCLVAASVLLAKGGSASRVGLVLRGLLRHQAGQTVEHPRAHGRP